MFSMHTEFEEKFDGLQYSLVDKFASGEKPNTHLFFKNKHKTKERQNIAAALLQKVRQSFECPIFFKGMVTIKDIPTCEEISAIKIELSPELAGFLIDFRKHLLDALKSTKSFNGFVTTVTPGNAVHLKKCPYNVIVMGDFDFVVKFMSVQFETNFDDSEDSQMAQE